jgi:hypothetical protein
MRLNVRCGGANRRFEFHKSGQFIRVHNETLSVVAVRVSNEESCDRWNLRLRRSPNSIRLY